MVVISPFARVASQLWELEYSIIPIKPASKEPGELLYGRWTSLRGWSDYCRQRATESEIERWSDYPDANIGLACGEASHVIVLDLDEDIDDMHARILAIVPPSPVQKFGSRGKSLFYRYNGEINQDFKYRGVTVAQILSTGRQTVLPPSKHPNGNHFYYLTLDTLESTPPGELPTLPDDFVEQMNMLFGYTTRKITDSEYSPYYGTTTLDEIERALNYISADDYPTWVNVGMSLQNHLGDRGYVLWDNWSQKSVKYKIGETQKKWHSFKNTGLTISTLFFYAMDGGYIPITPRIQIEVPPGSPVAWAMGLHNDSSVLSNRVANNANNNTLPELVCDHEIDDIGNSPPQIRVATSTDKMPDHLYDVPGLAGRIATWINITSIYPQPILAIGAALTMVGTLKSHRVCTPTDIRSHIYVMGLGETSSGKDHARRCIHRLFLYSNLKKLLIGVPVSGPGLIRSVRERKGRAICLIDEIGLAIKSMYSTTAATHKREIITEMMKLYTSGGDPMLGGEYANGEREDIDDPALSVYGMTVADSLFDALSSSEVISGFLNRWLIIASENPLPEENPDPQSRNNVPQSLIDEIQLIESMPTNAYAQTQLEYDMGICPRVIEFTAGAQKILHELKKLVRNRREKLLAAKNKSHAMWGRIPEIAQKLALIVQTGDKITERDMQWAAEFTTYWTEYVIDHVKYNIADNDHERKVNKILTIIRDYLGSEREYMTHRELSQRTSKWLRQNERNDILRALVEAEMIIVEETTAGGQSSRRYKLH
jgi:hypothetical protein